MDELAMRRKRLLYQSRHRGTQEGDLLLGGFAERRLVEFEDAELDQFEALVSATDAEVMDWVTGRIDPPEPLRGSVFNLLVEYKKEIAEN